MKWQGRRQSGNVTDMRGRGGRIGGGGMAAGGLGCGGIALMLIIALLTGVNPLDMMGGGGGGAVIPYEENSTERIEMTEEAGQDDELKALDLKPDTVYRYLKELTENGFILYIKKDGKDLITFTQKAKNLFKITTFGSLILLLSSLIF